MESGTMNFEKTAPAFQAKIDAIAKVANKTSEEVYELWRKYDKQCSMYDQSPVLFEFVGWYADDLGGDRYALMEALEQAEAAA